MVISHIKLDHLGEWHIQTNDEHQQNVAGTSIKERTYIVVSAEATYVDINAEQEAFNSDSVATGIDRRIENPFRTSKSEEPENKK